MKSAIKTLTFAAFIASSLYAVDCNQVYKVQNFVERFYTTVLERDPDNKGLDSWTNDLTSKTKTGTDVANGFLFSEEFIAKNKTNEEFIILIYQAFFNRSALEDTAGYTYWLNKLNSGEDRKVIAEGFLYSQEFANFSSAYGIQAYEGAPYTTDALDAFVQRFYSVLLGRNAQSVEIKAWTDQLSTKKITGVDIAYGFINSAEYNLSSKSNEAYINDLYAAFFDRQADAGGFENWLTKLNNGSSREEILDGFLHSQEFINLTNSFGILAFVGAPEPIIGENLAPVANAGASQTVNFGDNVILDASSSIDPDGNIVCHWWVDKNTLLSTNESFSKNDFSLGLHTIRLTVVDNGGKSNSSSKKITVQDAFPIITSKNTITVEENQLSALTAMATDDQGSVTYSISGGDSTAFNIDPQTGVIVFKTAPDFETKNIYSFTLTVTDSAGQSVTQTITIHISDVIERALLKQTGQIKSYDAGGLEITNGSLQDDGYYQKGISPSYTRDNLNNIVTDNITGLQWQDDTDVLSIFKPWITSANYDICIGQNGQNQNIATCADTSGDTAATYCSTLQLGGYNNWRLPTIDELMYIVDNSKTLPAIDNTVFQNVNLGIYWTSSTKAGGENNAWIVHFGNGNDGPYIKIDSAYVRCVRNKQP